MVPHHSDTQSAGGFRYIENLRGVQTFFLLVARSASESIHYSFNRHTGTLARLFGGTPYPWPHGHRLTQIVSRDA
jgi:hypothetical protein